MTTYMWQTAGQDAVDLEAASDEEVHAGLQRLLDSFPAVPLPREFSVLRTNWGTDPLFRGSYSFVGASASLADTEMLAAPLTGQQASASDSTGVEGKGANKDGIERLQVLFCGEATHTKYFGTTHGAYFTGQREAERLLQSFRLGC